MWVTKDNEIISDAEPDSDGFMEVRRPCPDCLGSGINCLQCAGSGSLPPVMEKVYPVYEWASKNSLQMGNDSNLLIVFYVQIMPDDFVMQLHRF